MNETWAVRRSENDGMVYSRDGYIVDKVDTDHLSYEELKKLGNIKGSWGNVWRLVNVEVLAYFNTAREAKAHADRLIAQEAERSNA